MKLVGRAKAIMLTPEAEWPVIGQEKRSAYGLFVPYVAVLAAIPEVAHFIGQSLIGGYRPIGAGLLRALVVYLASFAIVYLVAVVIDVSAARFGGKKSFSNALKLSVYAHTPLWLAGIFLLIPGLSFLLILGVYGIYSSVDRAAAAHGRAARARAAPRHPGDGLRADSRGRARDRVACPMNTRTRPDLGVPPSPLRERACPRLDRGGGVRAVQRGAHGEVSRLAVPEDARNAAPLIRAVQARRPERSRVCSASFRFASCRAAPGKRRRAPLSARSLSRLRERACPRFDRGVG